MKTALGLLLAFAIGVGCYASGIPLPAPPVLVGALVVSAMSVGYVAMDKLVRRREARYDGSRGGHSVTTSRSGRDR